MTDTLTSSFSLNRSRGILLKMVRRRSTARSSARSTARRSSYRRRPVRRRAYAPRAIPRNPAPTGLTSLSKQIRKVPFLMAHIDPFLPVVRGVKVPDTNTMESDTALCADEYSFTITSATNVKCVAFNPSITSLIVPSTEGAGAWTWPAAFASGVDCAQLANIQAASTAYRTVAHGIRLSCGSAPTTVTGFAHIAIYSPGTYGETTWPFPTTLAQMRDLPFYRKVTLASLTQSPLTIVNKFLDQTAFRYFDTRELAAGYTNSGRASFQITHSWATIFVAIENAPASSAPIGIESVLHIETIQKQGGTNSSSPAAPGNPELMAAAGHMAANTDASHFESEQGTILRQATDAVSEGLNQGAQAVAERLAPVLRSATANAVYYGTGAVLNAVLPRVGSMNINGQARLTNRGGL